MSNEDTTPRVPDEVVHIVADHCFGEAQSRTEWALDIAAVAVHDVVEYLVDHGWTPPVGGGAGDKPHADTPRPQVFAYPEVPTHAPKHVTHVEDYHGHHWLLSQTHELWYLRDSSGPTLPWRDLLQYNGPVTEVPAAVAAAQPAKQEAPRVEHEFDGGRISQRLYSSECTCGWICHDGTGRAVGYRQFEDALTAWQLHEAKSTEGAVAGER